MQICVQICLRVMCELGLIYPNALCVASVGFFRKWNDARSKRELNACCAAGLSQKRSPDIKTCFNNTQPTTAAWPSAQNRQNSLQIQWSQIRILTQVDRLGPGNICLSGHMHIWKFALLRSLSTHQHEKHGCFFQQGHWRDDVIWWRSAHDS